MNWRLTTLVFCSMALVASIATPVSAETVLIRVGTPNDKPLFDWTGELKVGGSTLFNFTYGGTTYKVKVTARERSAKDKDAMGTTTPLFGLELFKGHVTEDARVTSIAGVYPMVEGKPAACEIHVDKLVPEGFWITFGVGKAANPADTCDKMMRITRQMNGLKP